MIDIVAPPEQPAIKSMAKVEARSAACRYKWKELIGDFHSKLGRTHPDFCFNFNPSEQHPASQELLLVRIAYLLYSNMHGVRFEVTVAAFLIVILTDALIYCSFQQAVRRPPHHCIHLEGELASGTVRS